MKTGIVLLNFGGPWTLSDVKPFLYRLFSNPAVLVGVPAPFRQILAFMIAQIKGPSSIKIYKSIGRGSPQLKWTAIQTAGLGRLLPKDSHRVEMAMRSAEPSIERALALLQNWGADQLVLLPLFPHFSTTTTGTCFTEVRAALRRLQWAPVIHEVDSWPDHPEYARLLRRSVDEAIARAEEERYGSKEPIHILFSAHSLPLKIVKLGDPYPRDIERTIAAVTRDLNHPWSLTFQSRNGKLPWLEPYLEDELKRLGREGVKRAIIVPISFVSDHVETLFELDQWYADLAKTHGITHYYRARCFNGDPEFPRVLHSIFTDAMASQYLLSAAVAPQLSA
ncbi:MAG TPA: ferrochelatase [Pyrinomonadaceae bacterium]|nr:ferrochelatase [Pyrinomonadaceae bacterium]